MNPPTPHSSICHICKLPLDAPGALHCSAFHKQPSSTPETDALCPTFLGIEFLPSVVSLFNHARQLERELTTALARVEELTKDKEKLDWLDKNRVPHIYDAFKFHASNAASQKTWRTAIDTAIKQEKV